MSGEARGVTLFMPKLGQSMEVATILAWHVSDGDAVEEGQVIVSIETDKATYDLESPGKGIIHIAVPEGEDVAVETVIGSIDGTEAAAPAAREATQAIKSPVAGGERPPRESGRTPASPKARRLAAELGVDLNAVTASGADGVITADDVERAAATARVGNVPARPKVPDSQPQRRQECGRERLSGIRRTAVRRLAEAWQTIPHIVQMVDVDATGLLAERERLRGDGPRVSVNDLVLYATAGALAGVPDLNVSIEDDTLIRFEGVDVGFAVETARGLTVPVVRRADSLTIQELAAEVQRLTAAAKDSNLRPNDVGGASLTVSNLGMHGIRMGTPVINLGEPVLVFVGAIEDRPVVVGATVAVRPMMTISVAYDHRVADGVLAASLTQAIKGRIESFHAEDVPGPVDREEARPRELRVSSEGDGYQVEIRGRNRHRWVLDEPTDAGGTDEGPDPVEAFLGALLGCMTIAFKAAARRRKLPIDRVRGRIVANPKRQITGIGMTLEVWSPAPQPDLEALLPIAKRSCFVSNVLKEEVAFKLDLRVWRPSQDG